MPESVITLPGIFLRDGFAESEPDIVQRTQMDGGHVKRRLRGWPSPGSLSGSLYMPEADYDDLIDIYRDVARGGTPFLLAHPVSGDAIRVAFSEIPARQPAAAPGKCIAGIKLHKFGTLPARAQPPRTALSWPAGLPQYFSRNGFSFKAPDNVLRSDVQDGAMQVRLRSLAGPSPFEGTMRMTQAQYAAYCGFYKDTARGVLPFAFPGTDGAGTVQVQFGTPPSRRAAQGRDWIVSVNLEEK